MMTKRKGVLLVLSLLCAGLFFSCSKSENQSFLSQLEHIDAFIRQGQPTDAMRLLKKAEKEAFSAFARLGIYRRYITLGERELAEKVLLNALKSLPDNAELTAVYAQFLLRQKRFDEAVEKSRALAGTRYGSLYSESVLRKVVEHAKDGSFYSRDLASVYYDAFVGTGNTRWLMNSALLCLLAGDYETAAALQDVRPQYQQEKSIRSMAEMLFWAYVQYDAENYDVCLDNLSKVRSEVLLPAAAELASDAYVMLNDKDSAEASRKVVLQYKTEKSAPVSPAVKVNSAIWAQERGEFQRAYDLIFDAVTNNADYVPALVTYGHFAYEDSLPPTMTDLEKSLRLTEFRTHTMQAYDDRPKVLISDALYRMENCLAAEKAEGKEIDEDLILAQCSLYFKTTPDLTQTAKLAHIWKLLEENEMGRSLYPPKLVQLAVHELLANGKTEEARLLFTEYLDARYSLKKDEPAASQMLVDVFGGERPAPKNSIPPEVLRGTFGDRAAKGVNSMEIWEGETAAYFTLLDENLAAARRLYEYVLFETGGLHRKSDRAPIVSMSPLASPVTACNLAMLYSSTGDKKNALALYGLAAGRTRNPMEKADILYRTAVIQNELGDDNGALLSLEYCLSLNPIHADARLLRRMMQ